MMTSRSDIERIASHIAERFEAVSPGDVESVEALRPLYHPQVRFTDPVQRTVGREEFLEANRRLVQRTRVLSFVIGDRVFSSDQIFLTWTMRLALKLGPKLTETGVTHLRLRDGLVYEHRDHWDLSAFLMSAIPGGRRIVRAAMKPFL